MNGEVGRLFPTSRRTVTTRSRQIELKTLSRSNGGATIERVPFSVDSVCIVRVLVGVGGVLFGLQDTNKVVVVTDEVDN